MPNENDSRRNPVLEHAHSYANAQIRLPGPGKNADMNHDRIAGKWKQVSGALRAQWGELTGNRLRVIAGRHDQRAGKAQELYGIKKAEAQRELKEFLRRNRQWDVSGR